MEIRILTDGDRVVIERAVNGNKYRSEWVYRPDLPEGDYWGDCPKCYREDGVFHNDYVLFGDMGQEDWFVCHKHKLKWFLGSGLFSASRRMTNEALLKQEYILASYRTVEPITDFRLSPEAR
jgi:hypothetical protein